MASRAAAARRVRARAALRRDERDAGAAAIDPRPHQAPHRRPGLSDVDVVIVNWNSRHDTLACLEAVDAQARGIDATITVVDNGSTDGSIGAIAGRFPHVRLLPLGANHGFTGGLAAALARSPGRNVIFLNNDAVPQPEWLAAMLHAIDTASDDVVSIGGRIVDPTGALIDFIGGVMTFDGHAFQNGFRMPVDAKVEPAAGAEILFACGGNMISRRDALIDLGAFDDDYFAYLEDVDLGWRTWLSGRRALYEPRAVVRHKSSATSNRLGDFERGVLFERNALQTVLKNAENLRDVAGSIFFAYLRRMHHYTTRRNGGARELTREPFSANAATKPGFFARVKRRMFGAKPLATIDDPLTAMQFRALEWIMAHESRIAEKRTRVQSMRKRSDGEIFQRFPLHYVATYPGDEALLSGALFGLLRPDLPAVDKPLAEIIRA